MPGITVPLVTAEPGIVPARIDVNDESFNVSVIRSMRLSFHLRCRNGRCNSSLAPENKQEHIDTWLAGAQKIPPASQISGLSCNKCYSFTCAGCGHEPTLGQDNVFTTAGVVNSCCPRGRLYGIWLLLSNFDDREVASKRSQLQKSSKSKKAKSSATPQLGHFSESNTNGIGYAGGWDPYYSHNHNSTSAIFIDPEAENPDDVTTLDLKLLTALIPDVRSPDSPRLTEEILCLFRTSLLFEYLAELIRNDSIADLVQRRDLYTTLFVFLETIADNPTFRQLLFEERLNKKNSPGLEQICQGEMLGSQEMVSSLFFNGNNLFKQASTFLTMMAKAPPGSMDHSRESIRMCKTVLKLHEKLQPETAAEKVEVSATLSDEWAKYCEDNRVSFTDGVLKNHRHKDNFTSLKSSNKGRLTAIGKEIANMTTSLPTGIFLKVAESRSDVMKVLIVGIEDTPYAGGLFTFDLFLDANYPTSPPKMIFTLDGNDSEDWSFNPNLHKNTGTVCLSIINTWQGAAAEMWQPGKTTILAVLISIQAMILGSPIPWINEPGFINQEKTPEAHDHKLLIQYKTVRYAIIGWLGTPINPKYSVWEDISKVYWKHNGLSTFLTVKEWAKGNSLILKGSDPKGNKKMKKKFNIPNVTPDDLREKLANLLGLTAHLDPPTEATGSSSSVTRGKSKAAGKAKRKAEVLSDISDQDDSADEDEYGLVPKTTSKSTKKRKAAKGQSNSKSKGKEKSKFTADTDVVVASEDLQALPSVKWVYTGAKTQKETRAACADFGISGAKSIKDTIAKLEYFVNDNDLGDDEYGWTWGSFETDFDL